MEPVNILRDQPHMITPLLFKLHERVMGRIRLFGGDQFSPPVVPFPDQPRVPLKGLWACEIFCAKVAPQTISSSECRYATVGRNAGSCEDGYVPGGGEVCAGDKNLLVGGHS